MRTKVIPTMGYPARRALGNGARRRHRGSMSEWRLDPAGSGDSLSTPFEDWCATRGIHPETLGAWECFEASRRPAGRDLADA